MVAMFVRHRRKPMTSQHGRPARHAAARRAFNRRQFVALTAGAATALGGLPGAFGQGTPKKGGTLRVSAGNNPSTLDPMTGRSGFDHPLLYPMFDTLIEFDYETLTPQPGLAKAFTY